MRRQEAWGAAMLRITLGVIFVVHGYLALAVLTPPVVADHIVRMGYPPPLALPLAWHLVVIHLGGGALIVVGLWTRLAALLQVPIVASALFLVHLPQGFVVRGILLDGAPGDEGAGGYEYALLVLAATLALALLGGGALSIDARAGGRRHARRP